MKEHLLLDGRILISYIPCDHPPRPLLARLARLVSRLGGSDWRPEDRDVVRARHDGPFIHYEHRFLADEIAAEAAEAGLTVVFHDADGGRLVLGA